jgi:pimeloyl-ACP methyl ester carboxylesterase
LIATRTTAGAEKARPIFPRSAIVDADGPVYVADFGGSGRILILLHGLGGSHLDWSRVGLALAEDHRVLAMDLPGFGATPLGHRSAKVTSFADLLIRLLEKCSDGPVTLVGNSLGGLLSMIVASKRADLVEGLILVGSAMPFRVGPVNELPVFLPMYSAFATPVLGEALRWARWKALGPRGSALETIIRCCTDHRQVPPEIIGAIADLARLRRSYSGPDRAYLAALRSVLYYMSYWHNFDRLLGRINAPTLVVHGSQDRVVPVSFADDVAQMRPDWDFEVLEGLGHIPQLEGPVAFLSVVQPWLTRTDRQRRSAEVPSLHSMDFQETPIASIISALSKVQR